MSRQFHQTRILVADDERANLHLLSIALRNEGHLVDAAPDGPSALALARHNAPDLVLLDIQMPGMDGYEVLTRLREIDGCRGIPVIFLTGMEDLGSKLKGFSMGAVDYVVKPFHLEEVRARVRIHLQLALAHSALAQEQSRRLRSLEEAQRGLMVHPSEIPDARFSVHYRPAQEAGGDLYDVVSLGQGIHGYLVGDVSGHDVGTSLVAAAAKALLRQNAGPAWAPEETLRLMNRAMVEWLQPGRFLTASYIRLNRNTRMLRAVAAGHPPPAILSPDGRITILEADGDVLGAFNDARFGVVDKPVKAGDRVVAYTDGLFETGRDFPDRASKDLAGALSELVDVPFDDLPRRLAERLSGNSREDDVLVLAFQV